MKIKELFYNKVEFFTLKRVLIILPVLTIVDIVFFKEKGMILTGLVIGAACGLFRFFHMAGTFRRVLNGGNTAGAARQTLTRTLVSLLGAVAVLAASIVTNIWLFAGITAGILLVPFVLTINSLTEGLGITHNNFE